MSHEVAEYVKCQKPTVCFLGKSIYVLVCSAIKTITRGCLGRYDRPFHEANDCNTLGRIWPHMSHFVLRFRRHTFPWLLLQNVLIKLFGPVPTIVEDIHKDVEIFLQLE